MKEALHPILSCEEAASYEAALLKDEEAEWEAMNAAGRSLGQRLLEDFNESRALPDTPRLLLLLSKGHNSGDACLAADEILNILPNAEIRIYNLVEEADMRPLARKAYELIADRVSGADLDAIRNEPFQFCLDGLFGMQFKPPLRPDARELLDAVHANQNMDFRIAVDIPSGLGDENAFRADFTYATGIAKTPLFEKGNERYVGRIRYLDIGFFPGGIAGTDWDAPFLLTASILDGLRKFRPAHTDKKQQGHLFIIGGSKMMPGALLMTAKAAATAGLGLLTVFGPESVVPHLVGSLPEAMWVPWPETPGGGLALEGKEALLGKLRRADAVLIGPGMGREAETTQLIQSLVGEIDLPILLDADALLPPVIDVARSRPHDFGQVVLTPHAGEYQRIAQNLTPQKFSGKSGMIVVLKGPVTRIYSGDQCYVSTFGGPVLARGGSGDLLAGMLGARMTVRNADFARAACEAVAWHGLAAEEWARGRGTEGVRTTGLLDYLPEGLFYE